MNGILASAFGIASVYASVRRWSGALLALCLYLMACSEPFGNDAPDVDARPYVSGRAAADLSPDGKFQFGGGDYSGFPISAERARELGAAWLRTNAFPAGIPPGGRSFGEQVELEHGAIDWSRLRASASTFAAVTPYTDSTMMPAVLRSLLGSYYVVTILSGDRSIAVVGVSVHNTGHEVTASGRLTYDTALPNSYAFAVPPRGASGSFPLKPERAVKIAYESTGLRTAEVPVFVRPSRHFSPEISFWRITLEHEMYFARGTDGIRVLSDVIFVTPEGELALPVGERRDSIPYRYIAPDSSVHVRHYSPIVEAGMFTHFDKALPNRD